MDDQPQGPSSPAPASRRSPRRTSFDPPSRRSTNQRIGEILETARERAEQMAPSETPSPYDTISRSSAVRPAAPWLGHEDSSADENTGLVNSANRRASRRLETNANEPRRKSTTLRNSRDGSDTHAGDGQQGQNSQNGNGLTQTNGNSAHTNHNSWGEKVFKRFYSVELENKGSVARDHLALERTFLAWLRTSLAFASIGIAVTQLFRLNTSLNGNVPEDGRIHTLRHVGKPLGAAFLGISILTLILGYRRFLQGQEWVIKGKFPASRGTVLILVFMSLAIMLLSLVVVIVIHPTHTDGDL